MYVDIQRTVRLHVVYVHTVVDVMMKADVDILMHYVHTHVMYVLVHYVHT